MKLKNRRIGIYGGSFNPIHIGHLITAQYVVEAYKLDIIVFMPNRVSPHKLDLYKSQGTFYIDPEHRETMIKLAISDYPNFIYLDYEIKEESISYTYNSLKHLKETKYKNDELYFLMGSDSINSFNTWYNPEGILELSQIIVMDRYGNNVSNKSNKYKYCKCPNIEISSSMIRDRISQGLSINFMVPDKVKDYILDNGLYKNEI